MLAHFGGFGREGGRRRRRSTSVVLRTVGLCFVPCGSQADPTRESSVLPPPKHAKSGCFLWQAVKVIVSACRNVTAQSTVGSSTYNLNGPIPSKVTSWEAAKDMQWVFPGLHF